jgi:hypothetical protein
VAAAKAAAVPAAPKRPAAKAAPAPAAAPSPGAREIASFRDRVLLPDFRGLSVEEVTRITAGHGLRVKVQGRGRAIAQEPPPGTILPAGAEVQVDFAGAQARAPRGGPRSG